VRIEVKRDPDLGVAEAFARYLGMGASCEEVCSVAVPKIPLSARNLVRGPPASRRSGRRSTEFRAGAVLKILSKEMFSLSCHTARSRLVFRVVEFSKGASFWPGRLDPAWRSTG
jgi:hypothetical protein